MNETSKQSPNDQPGTNKIKSIIHDLKSTYLDSTSHANGHNLTNFQLEYNLQQKMMLILLNLASDPTVGHLVQKRRRELYEKTKLNMSKLQTHLQNQKFAKSQSNESHSNPLKVSSHSDKLNESKSFSSSSSSSTSSSHHDPLQTIDISPASIHRKDSYRRAQEQKLFLESNSNYLNKQTNAKIALTGRKVRTIQNNNSANASVGKDLDFFFLEF